MAALEVLPDVLRYDPALPAAYPNGHRPTDDVFGARFGWLTGGKVLPDGLSAHADLLADSRISVRPAPERLGWRHPSD